MEYKYETVSRSFEDFASGKVLFNARGTTSFPVRLGSEIYLRAKSYLRSTGNKDRITLYDPCCGGAHLLTAIGILHGHDMKRMIGSDIEPDVVEVAIRNLGLINLDGINARMEQLTQMVNEFGKDSHRQAVESARRLKEQIVQRNTTLTATCFQADATAEAEYDDRSLGAVDMVITDLPYGNMVKWTSDSANPAEKLLENLLPRLSSDAVVAVIADKKQVIQNANYKRLQKFKIGKRQVVFLQK
ncbi:hypothetical protein EBB07_24935 [Paenibacillaceae bacterium]|nr:hypothetical protein EBB07_24935 [Paenibacillaceae bacterium]